MTSKTTHRSSPEVARFNNRPRPEPIGNIPPAEAGERYCAMEPAMVVSIYSWEKGGLIAELVAAMSAVLGHRYSIPCQS